MGKRVNQSWRAVIKPYPHLELEEIDISLINLKIFDTTSRSDSRSKSKLNPKLKCKRCQKVLSNPILRITSIFALIVVIIIVLISCLSELIYTIKNNDVN